MWQAAVLDSLTLCKFLRHAFTDLHGETAALYEFVTGRVTGPGDLRSVGARTSNLKKLFNIREGWTRAEDTLPARLLEPSDATPTRLCRSHLESLIDAYYEIRDWDGMGRMPSVRLDEFGLRELVEQPVTPDKISA